jgi:aryl-alcohol dehydrogenase-like predicted oxidoreductase
VIGIGTARRYDVAASDAELAPLREVVHNFARMGGKLIDTAPSYGNAETVLGTLVAKAGNRDQLFLATKVGRGRESVQAGRAEMEQSLERLKVHKVDLMQVHNLAGVDEMLPVLREWKEAGKTRYIGVTTTAKNQYAELERVLRTQRMDFVEVDQVHRLAPRGHGSHPRHRDDGLPGGQPGSRSRTDARCRGTPADGHPGRRLLTETGTR